MTVLILGSDGYIGHTLTHHLLSLGHKVAGLDNYCRRVRVENMGSNSLTPIGSPSGRIAELKNRYGSNFIHSMECNLGIDSPVYLRNYLSTIKPDAIIHLAEQPSAAWSMISPSYAARTQQENIIGTLDLLWSMKEECPEAHLIKLGTMGEYGTPNCDISEGKIPEDCIGEIQDEYTGAVAECPMADLLFPRTANSFYHLSKVHDTHNIEFCCRNWGFRSTDIMQGIVFGLPNSCLTRFDYDECFGTVINRFIVQTLAKEPLTVYGLGNQIRGYLTIEDSIKCITIALSNPPEMGTYRTFNQFAQTFTINELTEMVCESAKILGITVPKISHIENPRNEAEIHYYNPVHSNLSTLGFVPDLDFQNSITITMERLMPYSYDIIKDVLNPNIKWR